MVIINAIIYLKNFAKYLKDDKGSLKVALKERRQIKDSIVHEGYVLLPRLTQYTQGFQKLPEKDMREVGI